MRKSKESSQAKSKQQQYLYYLVHFYKDPEEGVFDIALDEWITWDEKKKEFRCKFHSGDSSNEMAMTTELLKGRCAPFRSWKDYPVKIRGGADTYDQALERLDQLKDGYGFTTSDDEYAETQIQNLKKRVKNKRVHRNEDEIDNLFATATQTRKSRLEAPEDANNSPEITPRKRLTSSKSFSSKHRLSRSVSPPRRIRPRVNGNHSLSREKKRDSLESPELDCRRSPARMASKSPLSSSESISNLGNSLEDLSRTKDKYQTPKRTPERQSTFRESQRGLSQSKHEDQTPLSRRNRGSLPSLITPRTGDFPQRAHSSTRESAPHRGSFPASSQDPVMKYLRQLTSAVGQLQSQLVKVLGGIDGIKQQLNEAPNNVLPANRGLVVDLAKYHCDTLQQFQIFNEKLQEDAEFRSTISNGIRYKINLEKKTSSNIGDILRALMRKEILKHYTAQKKTGDKEVLAESQLWQCIEEQFAEEATRLGRPSFKEDALKSALSDAINIFKTTKSKIANEDTE